MFSVNVPLPPAIGRVADDLHPKLAGFDRIRERHTLVCKRIGADDVVDPDGENGHNPDRSRALDRLQRILRPILADIDPFGVAITGIGTFGAPTAGPGPVVHLTVESDPLVRLHHRLCTAFDPVEGLEGDAYVPHVTLARGRESVDDDRMEEGVVDLNIDPIVWRVDGIDLYDTAVREVAERVDL